MKVRMVNTPSADSNNEPVACYVAIELSKSGWLVGFLTPLSDKTGRYQVKAGDAQALLDLIERVHTRVARQLNRPVGGISCYEAGYDGFWLHRVLEAHGIHNHVLDPASLQVNRRARRAKTDRIDVDRMLRALIRYLRGEPEACSVAQVPRVEEEDAKRLHRERKRLVVERVQHVNRIKGLCAAQGIYNYAPLRPDRWSERDAIIKDPRSRHLNADKIKMLARAASDWPGVRHQPHRRGVLSQICQSSEIGTLCRARWQPVSQRLGRARPGHQQGWQSRGAVDDGLTRLDLVALSTR